MTGDIPPYEYRPAVDAAATAVRGWFGDRLLSF